MACYLGEEILQLFTTSCQGVGEGQGLPWTSFFPGWGAQILPQFHHSPPSHIPAPQCLPCCEGLRNKARAWGVESAPLPATAVQGSRSALIPFFPPGRNSAEKETPIYLLPSHSHHGLCWSKINSLLHLFPQPVLSISLLWNPDVLHKAMLKTTPRRRILTQGWYKLTRQHRSATLYFWPWPGFFSLHLLGFSTTNKSCCSISCCSVCISPQVLPPRSKTGLQP